MRLIPNENGLNQLCMITGPDGSQVTYTYDENGNRTAKSAGGNILQSYAYDFEDHIVQASGPGGILGTYYYNADGLRVAKVTASGTTGFIYDGMKLLQEVGATGQTTATYTSTGGNVYDPLVGIANAAGSHALLMDGLGSIRFLLDNTQRFSDGYVYEAFGRQVSREGQTPSAYRFVGAYGYYQDWETGLQLLTARYYDAEVGRFVTRDPIGFGGGDWNIYGYVGSSPIRTADPSGRFGWDDIPIWLKAIGGIGGASALLLAAWEVWIHYCHHTIEKSVVRIGVTYRAPILANGLQLPTDSRHTDWSLVSRQRSLKYPGGTAETWKFHFTPENTPYNEGSWNTQTFDVPADVEPYPPNGF